MTAIDSGDTGWVLVCTALVLLMTPGLAFFYAGMVRAKSVLSMLMQNYVCIAVVTVVWVVLGYTIAFGSDVGGGLLGGFRFTGLAHMTESVPGLSLHIPPLLFMAFQLMFAVITAALISGALADRVRFSAFVLFAGLWSLMVYSPLAHWAFSPEGWMAKLGVLDFAGGTVVEINSGASALAIALVVGRRHGWPREAMPPHSLPLTLLGAGLLWFGWFGFNAGSALRADGLAVHALVNTHLAGVGGLLAWIAVERIKTGVATTLGAASGAVAGLVAITPACGYLDSLPSLLLGALAGTACVLGVQLKYRFGYDDSLDVVGVHFVGGLVGTLFIGLFATAAVNKGVVHEGLLYGGGLTQLGRQAVGVLAATAWAFCATYLLARLVNRVIPLRVSEEEEATGLDQALHSESAYDFGSVRSMGRIG
ncbi:MAG: ammonium transporter, Amt family [Actinomycetota bacterium]|nr:ammonium transporter, Amt family [Actinomycetota bacterium]